MSQQFRLNINGSQIIVKADKETPLLYVLRDDLRLNGPKYGCGIAQCGSCMVLVNGEARPSCVLPVSAVGTAKITTLEGIGTAEKPHPLQTAFLEEQAAQCGYCLNGMIITAKALLDQNPTPLPEEVREGLNRVLCRCGTHSRIVKAVQRAAGNTNKG